MTVEVRLVDVDDEVRERLVEVAVTEAAPDEVTPPLTPGLAWSMERVAWLRAHHQQGRDGETTWAVVADGDVVGAVRLRRIPDSDLFETGIWLAWSARRRGIAAAAVRAVADEARSAGATGLRADTGADNTAARALLERLGFLLESGTDGRVTATLTLSSGRGHQVAGEGP